MVSARRLYSRFLLQFILNFSVLVPVFALPEIVFVTQPPHPADFATINSTFANHLTSMDAIPRGGDLYIRYSDGSLKNITKAAGYGVDGFQNQNAIAVRDPAVHWSGEKILFSMLIGAPTARYQVNQYYWQLYEVSGLTKDATPIITKVKNQASNYNNVMAVYGTDERIIFVSDRPRANLTHTYPQRDEYESTPTNTGLWSLDPETGDIFMMDHSPSGDFHPSIDSFGRVIFTRWDHLQRDQQNRCSQSSFGAFNYSNEENDAVELDSDAEVFPEPRAECERVDEDNLDRHSFNHFLPWQINEDGTELETINHIGRHELVDYLGKSFNDDPNVQEFYGQYSRVNQNSIEHFFQIQEDPLIQGLYYGINAPEFGTHASGQIISMQAAPQVIADQVQVNYLTHPDTANTDDTPSINHIGLSRDPLPLSDNNLVAVHAGSTQEDDNIGSSTEPSSKYSFRLRQYLKSNTYYAPNQYLTNGIIETISYWTPDNMLSYNSVTMWELQPREIRVRQKPARKLPEIPAIEKNIFSEMGVNINNFQDYLKENNLALIVSRNVTSRDHLDRQQPFNLRVAGTNTETIKNSGKIYNISHFQIFEGDLIRAYNGSNSISKGRRVLAQNLHSVSDNIPNQDGPNGSVKIAADGSMAALVPARKALTYQLTDEHQKGVVRERLWLTFQPGEIRVCTSCHGINSKNQVQQPQPMNPPQALTELLAYWQGQPQEPLKAELKVSLYNVQKKGKSKKIKLQIIGQNEKAKNKQMLLIAQVAGKNCGEVLRLKNNSSGNFEQLSKAINIRTTRTSKMRAKKVSIDFNLNYFGSKVSASNLNIKVFAKKISKEKICRELKRIW